MSKTLGLDIGTNSIGWAIVDTATNKLVDYGVKIFPDAVSQHAQRRRQLTRQYRRKNYRFAHRLLLTLQNKFTELVYQPAFIDKVKKTFPAFILSLLAVQFAGSLLMAVFNAKDFNSGLIWLLLSCPVGLLLKKKPAVAGLLILDLLFAVNRCKRWTTFHLLLFIQHSKDKGGFPPIQLIYPLFLQWRS